VDAAPISNADIAPTFAQILGFDIASKGTLKGRVLSEALPGGPASMPVRRRTSVSDAAGNGKKTILMYQQTGQQVYFDQACFRSSAETCK
jgi:arylsulfatase A-like enzyme